MYANELQIEQPIKPLVHDQINVHEGILPLPESALHSTLTSGDLTTPVDQAVVDTFKRVGFTVSERNNEDGVRVADVDLPQPEGLLQLIGDEHFPPIEVDPHYDIPAKTYLEIYSRGFHPVGAGARVDKDGRTSYLYGHDLADGHTQALIRYKDTLDLLQHVSLSTLQAGSVHFPHLVLTKILPEATLVETEKEKRTAFIIDNFTAFLHEVCLEAPVKQINVHSTLVPTLDYMLTLLKAGNQLQEVKLVKDTAGSRGIDPTEVTAQMMFEALVDQGRDFSHIPAPPEESRHLNRIRRIIGRIGLRT